MTTIRQISERDAPVVADLHIEGQPGTFLTKLGKEFLTTFYSHLCRSEGGFGIVAEQDGEVVGVGVATMDTGALFREMIVGHGLWLVLPVAKSILRHPSLIADVVNTLRYPAKVEGDSVIPEFLYLGVRRNMRGQGIGTRLMETVCWMCRQRGADRVSLTVDASNRGAQRLYLDLGWERGEEVLLYGRPMIIYTLDLTTHEFPPSVEPI
jgi:ribosomal protein S18 acetylase RimI-like enzyme